MKQRVELWGGQAQEGYEVAFPEAEDFGVTAVFWSASGEGDVEWLVTVKSP